MVLDQMGRLNEIIYGYQTRGSKGPEIMRSHNNCSASSNMHSSFCCTYTLGATVSPILQMNRLGPSVSWQSQDSNHGCCAHSLCEMPTSQPGTAQITAQRSSCPLIVPGACSPCWRKAIKTGTPTVSLTLKFWKPGSVVGTLNLAEVPQPPARDGGFGLPEALNHLLGPASSRPARE